MCLLVFHQCIKDGNESRSKVAGSYTEQTEGNAETAEIRLLAGIVLIGTFFYSVFPLNAAYIAIACPCPN